MQDYFNQGLMSKINMSNWAQMPAAGATPPAQQLPTPITPMPANGVGGVADYWKLPTAGGTPAAAAAPVTQTRPQYGGILGAILNSFKSQGLLK